ncbi:MAG: RluA family pseudouridine synthase [Bacteriovoracaceae bacterium]
MKFLKVKKSGVRLDIFLTQELGITRNQAQKRVESGSILVDGKTEKSNKKLEQGSLLTILEEIGKVTKKDATLIIKRIYQDDNLIVIDKDPGTVVYPSYGHESGTIIDALKADINFSKNNRSGIVHRLDKDTSGLMIIARNEKTEDALKREIKERQVLKKYLVLVWGRIEPAEGFIDIPLKRSEKDRKKITASSSGRLSKTQYKLIKYYKDYSLLEARILTGRTHQIRVHFSSIGFPVVGDKTYGKKSCYLLPRQFLHASYIRFNLFGKTYSFESELPLDLKNFLNISHL